MGKTKRTQNPGKRQKENIPRRSKSIRAVQTKTTIKRGRAKMTMLCKNCKHEIEEVPHCGWMHSLLFTGVPIVDKTCSTKCACNSPEPTPTFREIEDIRIKEFNERTRLRYSA